MVSVDPASWCDCPSLTVRAAQPLFGNRKEMLPPSHQHHISESKCMSFASCGAHVQAILSPSRLFLSCMQESWALSAPEGAIRVAGRMSANLNQAYTPSATRLAKGGNLKYLCYELPSVCS